MWPPLPQKAKNQFTAAEGYCGIYEASRDRKLTKDAAIFLSGVVNCNP